jgi:acyl-CoA thioester hydrolase
MLGAALEREPHFVGSTESLPPAIFFAENIPMTNPLMKSPNVCSADADAIPSESFTASSVVYPWQCDHMGHMNVMWYAGKFDEATWHLLSQIGITPSYLRANRRYMATVQQETAYKRELFAGDLITIRSSILEIRDKVIRLCHEMLNGENGKVAATTTLTGVHLASFTRKSCPFPIDILERGRRMIVDGTQSNAASR